MSTKVIKVQKQWAATYWWRGMNHIISMHDTEAGAQAACGRHQRLRDETTRRLAEGLDVPIDMIEPKETT